MRKALRIVAFGVAGLAVVIVAILAMGARLPVAHVASVSAAYGRPPEEVWDALTAYQQFPAWRSGVDRVEQRTFPDGSSGWIEDGATGPMPLAVEVAEPPRRLRLRIASDELPFGGTWTYELTPDGAGTRVRITEDGRITNLFFRFMARFVFGYTATMEAYLIDLGAHFGEQTTTRLESG